MRAMEVAPGVHRLAWSVGAKPMAVYLRWTGAEA
jgi:hypothetical protein